MSVLPRRQALAAFALFPLVAAGIVALTPTTDLPWWAWAWLATTAALSSVVAASYLPAPGVGLREQAGCSPCAALAGVYTLFAIVVHADAPTAPVTSAVATGLIAWSVFQRLRSTPTCATSPSA